MDYRDKTFFGVSGGDGDITNNNDGSENEEEAHKIEIVEGSQLDIDIPKIKPLPAGPHFALSRQDSSDE